jgi:excisionase family DNA binding protein
MSITSTGLGDLGRGILSTRWADREVFTIDEAGLILGLSRPSAYAAARNGEIPTIRVGRRLIVPRYALEKMLSQCEVTKSAKAGG